MKRYWIAAAVVVSTMGAVGWAEEAAQPEAAPAGKPKIVFDKTVYDFGTTSMVQSVVGTFTFSNAGTGELRVEKPSVSCGCTVASVKPNVLKPGEKGELVFTLNVAGVRGHTEKLITVPSNDPDNPQVRLTLKADVKQIFEANPQQVLLGDMLQGSVTNFTIQLKRTDGQKLVITKTETSGSAVEAQLQPVENAPDQMQLLVKVNGQGAPRRLAEWVRVYADEATAPTLHISLYGRLIGDITLTPEALFWGIPNVENWPGPQPDLMTTRRLVVAVTKPDQKLEVKNPTCSLSGVQLELQPVEAGRSVAIVAKLTEPPKESQRGVISFETNVPTNPRVEVPVTINVLQR